MSVRADISKKNKYWISKHRYYELKHFCLQYDEWKQNIVLLSPKNSSVVKFEKSNETSNPTERLAMRRLYYSEMIKMVEDCAFEADKAIGKYILEGVTQGLSYEHLLARYNIPCGKDLYYSRYRKFFWLLSMKR